MIVASIPITFKSGRAADLLGHMTETGREYEFVPDVTLPEGCSAAIEIVKPDGMFVISECGIVNGNIIVTLPAQALAVRGMAHYIIRITTADDKIIFSAAGSIWVDDALITNELLESISEVYGLTFPDDFLTEADLSDYAKKSEVPQIEANPAGAADYDLNKLKLNNVIYKIPDAAVAKTATGNPIEINDGASAPLVKCVTQITGYQSGTGTPSPENIRPIVAYTEGEIEVRGKNLCDKSKLRAGDYNGSNARIRVSENVSDRPITISGTAYTCSFTPYGSCKYQWVVLTDDNNTIVSNIAVKQAGSVTFTASQSGLRICTVYGNTEVAGGQWDNISVDDVKASNPQIEKGSTATPYEPYTSTTHTTTYPSAIYRGSEDVVNGEVTSEMVVIDLGSLTWTYSTQYNRFTTTLTGYKKPSSNTVPFNAICSCYETVGSNYTADSSYDSCIGANSGSDVLVVRDTRYTDATAFTSAVTGQTLAYELATPTTSSVTPTNLPIKSLFGYSHIESSTGEMEIEYITAAYEPLIGMHYYSSAEQVIGRWIDGRPVYQKSFHFAIPLNNYVTVATSINNFDMPIKYEGIVALSTGIFEDICFSRPDSGSSTYYTAVTSTGDFFFKTYEAAAGTAYVTMRYLKQEV